MRKTLLALLLVSVAFAFLLGFETKSSAMAEATPMPSLTTLTPSLLPSPTLPVLTADRTVRLALPAVNKQDVGTLATLTVRASRGDGSVFMRLDNTPLANTETQNSLRTAVDAARAVLGEPSYAFDVTYAITADSDVVGGQSAGAAAAIATIAALNASKLDASVLITGTIDANGNIGRVGKILQKAKAVKAAGYQLFLVPPGESLQTVLQETCETKTQSGVVTRQCQTRSVTVNVSQDVGIPLVEVGNIRQALPYFARAS